MIAILAKIYPSFCNIQIKLYLVLCSIAGNIAQVFTKVASKENYIVESNHLKKKSVKTIIFIRHGRSFWNYMINDIDITTPIRIWKCLFKEIQYIPSEKSILFDSPLNQDGIQQAIDQSNKIKDYIPGDNQFINDVVSVLQGNNTSSSIIISSTLRRALETVSIALWSRIDKSNERIRMNDSIREISPNLDCKILNNESKIPDMSGSDCLQAHKLIAHFSRDYGYEPTKIFEPVRKKMNRNRENNQNDQLEVVENLFSLRHEVIIMCGHSLWFRNFFRNFIGRNINHISKNRKIENCGVVAFKMICGVDESSKIRYQIDHKTITPIFLGFKGK